MPRCNCAPISETRWQQLLRLQAEIGAKQAEFAHVMKAAQDAGELRVRGTMEPLPVMQEQQLGAISTT